MPESARRRLRDLAHGWLTQELARWSEQIQQEPTSALAGKAAAYRASREAAMAIVRDEAKLAALPSEEAERWRALWRELDRLLTR